MKKRFNDFLGGFISAVLVMGLSVSAFGLSERMTITVDPINIQVNGVTFQPKDVTGSDVPVFAYNGTTYAPLRALAEAYGLKVGYDASTNMATVDIASIPAPTEVMGVQEAITPQKPGTPTISVERRYHRFPVKLGDEYGYYEMNVSWTPVNDADGYILYVREGDWGEWKVHKTYDRGTTSDTFAYWFEEVWYFKVVAFSKSDSGTTYGDESNTVAHKYRLYG